ncbi:MAG TPA: hypothetical protein VH915_00780, partial [Pedococcus sp.]
MPAHVVERRADRGGDLGGDRRGTAHGVGRGDDLHPFARERAQQGAQVDLAREGHAKLGEALALQARVRERERLARTVHDGVLQTLAYIHRTGS